ncbi:Modification methylase DpnIIA [subsurface metagenome]
MRANKFQGSILNYFGEDNNIVSLRNFKRRQNKKNKKIVAVPHPFIKWAGGKKQLLGQIDKYLPKNFNKYLEPFVGGGALFFYLLPNKAILIDSNKGLINCYRVIQNKIGELIKSLKKHKNEKDYFYKIRSLDRIPEEFKKLSSIERASRTIFLNKCCFNGLYRVNSKGEFNAPFGKYENPKFCDEENLLAVNMILKDIQIINGDFKECLELAEKDDFIYFDPPYQPISTTANFTSYTKENFNKKDQVRLFKVYEELDNRGCKVMLSNSYNEFILDLYKKYDLKTVYAKRAINSDASGRGQIKEVLIINY